MNEDSCGGPPVKPSIMSGFQIQHRLLSSEQEIVICIRAIGNGLGLFLQLAALVTLQVLFVALPVTSQMLFVVLPLPYLVIKILN